MEQRAPSTFSPAQHNTTPSIPTCFLFLAFRGAYLVARLNSPLPSP